MHTKRKDDQNAGASRPATSQLSWCAFLILYLALEPVTQARADRPPAEDAGETEPAGAETPERSEAATAERAEAGTEERVEEEIGEQAEAVSEKQTEDRTLGQTGAKPGGGKGSGAAGDERRDRSCPVCPAYEAPRCCAVKMGAGPRLGITVNGDQWIAGGHLRLGIPCLGGLGMSPVVITGFGGNHLTLRASLRLDYLFWIGGERGVSIYPAVGGSIMYYLPVGHFASFCSRVDLDECWGLDSGLELGGGVGYRWFALDAVVGIAGLPVVTITATATFSLLGSREKAKVDP